MRHCVAHDRFLKTCELCMEAERCYRRELRTLKIALKVDKGYRRTRKMRRFVNGEEVRRELWGAPEKKEVVNHPSHYGGDTTYEHIKVCEAWGLGYCLGNATKYICRAGKKTEGRLEDLKKSLWYLQREITNEETKPKV